MDDPRFSVVIPTRNRADTLLFTLRTCLEQDFEDYEIIVSDNGSDLETRQLVEQLASPLIRYIHTPRPLAMSDSWEFALEQARGEYVTILGADDGLLSHCLRDADEILRMSPTQALRWESVLYTWPNLPRQPYQSPDRLTIPLPRAGRPHVVKRVESRTVMAEAGNSRLSYAELPMIYCSAIHRDLIARLRTLAGRVFKSESPDVYSSFALACVAGTYCSVDTPLAINALSGRSNGVATLYLQNQTSIGQEFQSMNAEARLLRHPWVPELQAMAACVADSFLHAKCVLFPENGDLTIDRKLLIRNCLTQTVFASDEEWQQGLRAMERSLVDDAELTLWFAAEFGCAPRPAKSLSQLSHQCTGERLHLQADQLGVSDVHGASQLCEKLLAYRSEKIRYQFAPEASESAQVIDHLNTQLREKQAMIEQLASVAVERLKVIEQLSAVAAERLKIIEQQSGDTRRFSWRWWPRRNEEVDRSA